MSPEDYRANARIARQVARHTAAMAMAKTIIEAYASFDPETKEPIFVEPNLLAKMSVEYANAVLLELLQTEQVG